MKTRNGFVSNSSSSSFLIYGVRLELGGEELGMLLKEHENEILEVYAKYNQVYESVNDILEEEGIWEISEILSSIMNVTTYTTDYAIYMGCSWSSVGDDETGSQFKQSIRDSIGMDNLRYGTHDEVTYG